MPQALHACDKALYLNALYSTHFLVFRAAAPNTLPKFPRPHIEHSPGTFSLLYFIYLEGYAVAHTHVEVKG